LQSPAITRISRAWKNSETRAKVRAREAMTKAQQIKEELKMARLLHQVVMLETLVGRKAKNHKNVGKITRMSHRSQLPSRSCVNGRVRFARKSSSRAYLVRMRPSQ
jgi:hypothetical protein